MWNEDKFVTIRVWLVLPYIKKLISHKIITKIKKNINLIIFVTFILDLTDRITG